MFYVFLQRVLIRTLHNENGGKSVIRRSTLSRDLIILILLSWTWEFSLSRGTKETVLIRKRERGDDIFSPHESGYSYYSLCYYVVRSMYYTTQTWECSTSYWRPVCGNSRSMLLAVRTSTTSVTNSNNTYDNSLSLEVLKRLFSLEKWRRGDIFNPTSRATPITILSATM